MITRVNFFKSDQFSLSYQKMAVITVILLACCLLFYSIQSNRSQKLSKELRDLTAQVEGIKKTQGINVGSNALNPVETVTLVMLSEPDWPETLKAISSALTESIWLENIQAGVKAQVVDNKNKKAAPAKTTAAPNAQPTTPQNLPTEIVIEGTTYQSRLLPGFADRLRGFNAFAEINLNSGEAASKELNAAQKFKVTGVLKSQ